MLARGPVGPAASAGACRRRPKGATAAAAATAATPGAAAAAAAAARQRRRQPPSPIHAAASASSSAAAGPPPPPPPPIVEWCPAGADASVDEDESEDAPGGNGGSGDAWRRPLEGWTTTGRSSSSSTSSSPEDHDAPPHHPQHSLPPVVALGKFDALHRGHRALARAAAADCRGAPVLISFSGMAAVLGWPRRRPLVARQDRARVLDLWARELAAEGVYGEAVARAAALFEAEEQRRPAGGGVAAAAAAADDDARQQPPSTVALRPYPPVRQRYVPFASVRSLPPEAFVDLLRGQMRAAGAVAGANFRFGFRAEGDSDALEQLCRERGMSCKVVRLLMRRESEVAGGNGTAAPSSVAAASAATASSPADERGAVSSSRVREQLAAGRVEAAARSLGRPHRVVYVMEDKGEGGGDEEAPQQAAVQREGGVGGGGGGGISPSPPTSSSHCWLPLAPAHALRNQPPAAGEYRALLSCYALPEGVQGRDCCLLDLESRQRRLLGSGQRGREQEQQQQPAAAGGSARIFEQEVGVRLSADGDLLAEASAARRCLTAEDQEESCVVVAVDFLRREGGGGGGAAAAGRRELATEEEEDAGG
jgi:FAD synthase